VTVFFNNKKKSIEGQSYVNNA